MRKKYRIRQRIVHDLHENTNSTYEGAGVFSPDLYSRLVILSEFLQQRLSRSLDLTIYLSRKAARLIMNHNKSVPLFLYLAYQSTHYPIPTPPRQYLVKLTV